MSSAISDWEPIETTAPKSDWEPVSPKEQSLLDEQKKVRREGKMISGATGAIEGISRYIIEPITPAGLMNQGARLQSVVTQKPVQDPFQAGRPILDIPEPTGKGFGAGLARLGIDVLKGFTTPEAVVTLPVAAQSKVILALFGGQMAEGLPDEVVNAVKTMKDPNASTADKVVAVGNPIVQSAMIAAIKAGVQGKSPLDPIKQLAKQVKETKLPETEPKPIVQGALPKEPSDAVGVTVETGDNLQPDQFQTGKGKNIVPPKQKPVVPETPPEEGRDVHVLDEIKTRGLKTKKQIQSVFPHLSNEEAAALRNQAWGKPVELIPAAPQPVPAAETPLPIGSKPVAPVENNLEKEIPLGINRESKLNPNLGKMSDSDFDSEYRDAKKQVYDAEKVYDSISDPSELTREQRQKIADAQDRWNSVSLERFRRNSKDIYPSDLMSDLRKYATNAVRFGKGSDDFQKAKIIMDELQRQGANESDLLKEIQFKSADDAEIFKADLQDIKKVAEQAYESPPSPEPKLLPQSALKVGDTVFAGEAGQPHDALEAQHGKGQRGFIIDGKFEPDREVAAETPTTKTAETPKPSTPPQPPIQPALPPVAPAEPKPAQAGAAGESPKPPKVEPVAKPPIADKSTIPVRTAKSAADISTTAAEAGFDELPEDEKSKYSPVAKADQIQKVHDLVNGDFESARAIVRGEKPVPNNIKGQVLWNAMEKVAMEKGDASMINDLVKSPLAAKRSIAAQELGASAFNQNPHSPTEAVREITTAREADYLKKTGQAPEKVRKSIINRERARMNYELGKVESKRQDWGQFIHSIQCK